MRHFSPSLSARAAAARSLGAVALSTLVLFGCDEANDTSQDAPAPRAAAPAVEAGPTSFFDSLESAKAGQPELVWRALPASYRTDVESLIHEFAGKMDAKLWSNGAKMIGKVGRVLEEKGAFVVGHPMVQMFAQGGDPAEMTNGLKTLGKTLSSIAASDVGDVEKLRQLDVDRFLDTTIGDAVKDVMGLVGNVGAGMADTSALTTKIEAKLVSEDGDSATVEVKQPDGEVQSMEMVKVGGAWIPKEMADDWTSGIDEAKANLASMELSDEDKQMATSMMMMVESYLDKMLQAEEQEDFNDVIDGLMQIAESMGGGG